jgi:hypothetical protein
MLLGLPCTCKLPFFYEKSLLFIDSHRQELPVFRVRSLRLVFLISYHWPMEIGNWIYGDVLRKLLKLTESLLNCQQIEIDLSFGEYVNQYIVILIQFPSLIVHSLTKTLVSLKYSTSVLYCNTFLLFLL